MILGQSAGIAAAMTARKNTTVQKLPYPELRVRLLERGQVLELPEVPPEPKTVSGIDPKTLPGVVLDDGAAELKGSWSRSTNFKPYIGKGYVHDGKSGNGSATATFRFKVPHTGRYQLLMAYSAHETRAKKIPLGITSGTNRKTILVDQTLPLPDGQYFRPIGTVDLSADVETEIQISNQDTTGFVVFDALQLLPAERK